MSLEKVKQILIESIENIEDEAFLEAISLIVQRKNQSDGEPVLSDNQNFVLQESKSQSKGRSILSNTEAVKSVEEKFKK